MSAFQIDKQFLRFGSLRFATDKITSFKVNASHRQVQGSNNRFSTISFGIVAVFVGGLVSVWAMSKFDYGWVAIGFVASVVGVLIFKIGRKMPADGPSRQTVYELILTTNAGEVAAYETTAYDVMKQIESALEQAIIDARR